MLAAVFWSGNSAFAEKTLLYTYFQDDSPPRYFERNNGDTGICVDIIDALNARLEPLEIAIINPEKQKVPRKRITEYLKASEEIDLFVGGAKTEEMEEWGQFSVPLYPLKSTFAKRRDDPSLYVDSDSVKGLTVGVLRGSRSVQTMNQIEGVTVEETNTMEQSLKKLAAGRVDLVYYHNMGLGWQIKSFNLGDHMVVVDEYKSEPISHYIIYSKTVSPNIIAEIDTVIESMQTDGTLDRILEKYK
jgi:polar amino acid transport system substrate-binding protein